MFKERVLEAVKKIPKGDTKSYGEIAILAGNPKAARAVGNIIHNSPSDVPCHRVVTKDGGLSKSFGKGGIKRQKELLEKEGLKIKNNKVI